ncbi:MAG: DUF2232 domain-containing protein [Deltaproteobacteria bacterium]|nr:DUF2232 domain-containing protein [Deltaproteobacteria bacterium]
MRWQPVLLTAGGIGVTLLCLLGGSWLGPLGAALNLLTPMAAAYLSMRFGLRAGIIVVAVVSLLLLQMGPLYTLTAYLGLFGTGSLLLPWLLKLGQSWDRAVFLSVAGAVAVTGLLAVVALLTSKGGFDQLVGQVIQTEVDQAMHIYRQAGVTGAKLKELQQVVDGLADFIRQNFYGLYVAGVLVVQLLSLVLLQGLKRNDYRIPGVPFSCWHLPAVLIWVLIVAGFFMLLPVAQLTLVGRNLLAVLLPLYFVQGLAVVSNFLQRKAYPPAVKGLIYTVLVIFNPLPLLITGVGIFDLWIDFRRPRNKDK